MRRTLFVIPLLLIICKAAVSKAQPATRSAYHDAQYFKRFVAQNSNHIVLTDDTKEVLRFYFGDVVDTSAVFQRLGNANPFLNKFIAATASGQVKSLSAPASMISSVSGLDVTNVADALAKFLVKRAKQELTIAFFEKFNDFISKYPDCQTVFPDTYLALTVIGTQIYQYQGYIQTLRESFNRDLNALDKNLPSIINNHPLLFKRRPEAAAVLKSGCYIAGALKDEVHPGQIVSNYPTGLLASFDPDWKGAIQTLQLFSGSLRDTGSNGNENHWVSEKQVRRLVTDTIALRLYLGLLYQQAGNFNIDSNGRSGAIHFNSTTLKDLLAGIAGNMNPIRDYITALGEKTEKLNTLIKAHQKAGPDTEAIEQYYSYFNSSIDLVEHCATITDIPVFRRALNTDLPEQMKGYFDIARSTSNLVVHIAERKFSAAIVTTVHVYDLIVKRNEVDLPAIENANRVTSNIFKYGSFMAAIVQAQNSDDVEQTIEAFALPQGSSRIKRESAFNVSLNGYVGLFYGHEYIKSIKDRLAFNSYGVTAPVGVCVSRGQRRLFKPFHGQGNSSFSLFISLLDVGAVAAYRVQNDSIAQVPTITLRDIFSPGAFVSVGIPRTPLSLNLGVQSGPNLRKVSNKNSYNDKTYMRLSASLCVDIPFLNVYTKSN